MAFPHVSALRSYSRWLLACGWMICLGCGGADSEPVERAEESSAPSPIALNVDGEPEISVSTIRRELGANSQAQFTKAGGKIIAVNLMHSEAKTIEPLRGLPLKYLDLTELPIADLSPLSGMPLNELYLEGTQVQSLDALRGLPLRVLRMEHTLVTDLSPLEGMPLEQLNVYNTQVTDISVISKMPLNTLWVSGSRVNDLSPLRDIPLESLDIENTPVTDLEPLAGKTSLKRLNIAGTDVTDLRPLRGLRLERLIFSPERITLGMEIVREMSSLQSLGEDFESVRPAPQFWATWD